MNGHAVSVANILVHKGLSETWFVQLIVAPATVCNEVNYDVLFNRVENKVRRYKRLLLWSTDLAEEVTIFERCLHRTSNIWKNGVRGAWNNDDEKMIPCG